MLLRIPGWWKLSSHAVLPVSGSRALDVVVISIVAHAVQLVVRRAEHLHISLHAVAPQPGNAAHQLLIKYKVYILLLLVPCIVLLEGPYLLVALAQRAERMADGLQASEAGIFQLLFIQLVVFNAISPVVG